MIETIDEIERALADNQYISNRGLATAIFVALQLVISDEISEN